MRGGEIEIAGDAGDLLGGPLAGELAGMAGGVLLVRGRAGARAGDRLRRGLIVVEGGAGDGARLPHDRGHADRLRRLRPVAGQS